IYDSWAIDKNGYHKRPWNGTNSSSFQEGIMYTYEHVSSSNSNIPALFVNAILDTTLHDEIDIEKYGRVNFDQIYIYFGERLDNSVYEIFDQDNPVNISNAAALNLIANDAGWDVNRISDKDILLVGGYSLDSLPDNYADLEMHVVCVCWDTITNSSYVLSIA
ncbi:MAG: hypothetical protein J6W76_01725, partial [Spirochaetales bacterium]|nr:hypothetical protein [Spirochaetales bacterium]